MSKDNADSQRNIKSIDQVLIRSPFGNYLKASKTGELLATSSVNENGCVFSIQKANIPPFPQWVHTRPYISASNLIPEFSRYTNEGPNNRISDRYETSLFNSHEKQEKILIEELLYALLSVEGNFIKKKATEDRERFKYYIDRN